VDLRLTHQSPAKSLLTLTGNGVSASNAYSEYGPSLSTLWIHAYSGYGAEVAAMEGGTADMIDMTLLPTDYATMAGETIGGQPEFNFSTIVSLGTEQIDWNTAFYPFNITDYTKAVSDILQIDKVNFVNTWVGSYPNGGLASYSPIPGMISVNSNWPWYNPNTANIYNGGYADALSKLLDSDVLSQAPLAQDSAPGTTVPGGYVAWTWNFSAPYPMASDGNSYNPLLTGGIAGGEGDGYMGNGASYGLQILTRSEDVRQYIVPEVVQWLGANFTWWYLNVAVPENLPVVTTFKNDVASAGGDPATAVPYISVQNIFGTMSDFEYPVMIFYCYEMYTAGYSYGFTPDSMLESYLVADSPQAYQWSIYLKDDTCYVNPIYDGLETLMENASSMGNPLINPLSQPGTAVYYCYKAQMELMGGGTGTLPPACFPYFDEVGYSPIPAADEHGIANTYSPISSGFGNWYTYLNMYDTANSPYYSTNAALQGLRRGTLSGANPLSSYTVYDFAVFSDIYDSLAISNPYNLSQLIPYIATNWNVGTWSNTGNGVWAHPQTCSNITLTMRSDDEWQDVPGPELRNSFTLDNGSELNGGDYNAIAPGSIEPGSGPLPAITDRFMTPLDVAFTYAYGSLGVGFTAFYTMEPWCMQIDHIVISSAWESAWEAANPLGPTGYPWANETAIEGFMGITPHTLAWPTWQYVTPPVDAYYNTSAFTNNLVQFSPSLGLYQVQIYSSLLIPWLIAYRALGYIILPMDIFSHLAQAAWPTTSIQGNSYTTSDVTLMDLEPHTLSGPTGADLEYGSSAWILVDDPQNLAATTWRLDAYRAGLTYGPTGAQITTDHSYFWYSPVRTPYGGSGGWYPGPDPANTGAPNPGVPWLVNSTTLDIKDTYTNYASQALNVSIYYDLVVAYASSGAGPFTNYVVGTPGSPALTSSQTTVINWVNDANHNINGTSASGYFTIPAGASYDTDIDYVLPSGSIPWGSVLWISISMWIVIRLDNGPILIISHIIEIGWWEFGFAPGLIWQEHTTGTLQVGPKDLNAITGHWTRVIKGSYDPLSYLNLQGTWTSPSVGSHKVGPNDLNAVTGHWKKTLAPGNYFKAYY